MMNNFVCKNIKSFYIENSILTIHSKPDRKSQKLTLCGEETSNSPTAHTIASLAWSSLQSYGSYNNRIVDIIISKHASLHFWPEHYLLSQKINLKNPLDVSKWPLYMVNLPQICKSRKHFKRQLGFEPITFTFSKNSHYGRESLLEV